MYIHMYVHSYTCISYMYVYLGRANLEGHFELLQELDIFPLQTVGEGVVPEQMRYLHNSCSERTPHTLKWESTTVETLGAYYQRQTRAHTASLFVSTCALLLHTKWPAYCSHTMQEAVYLCNGAVLEKSFFTFVGCRGLICILVYLRENAILWIRSTSHKDSPNKYEVTPLCSILCVRAHCVVAAWQVFTAPGSDKSFPHSTAVGDSNEHTV